MTREYTQVFQHHNSKVFRERKIFFFLIRLSWNTETKCVKHHVINGYLLFKSCVLNWLYFKLAWDNNQTRYLQKNQSNKGCWFLRVSWRQCTVNSKKYDLCYKDYSTINSKSPRFETETLLIMIFKIVRAWASPPWLFVQHNIGFIKYHNSRTNIYMPACFLTRKWQL